MFELTQNELILLLITIIWVLPWKAYSLWNASKRGEKGWFVVILVLNTFGIIEIFYTFFIAKKKWSDIRWAIQRVISRRK